MPYDFYNMGAAQGRIVGQGLMAMGQGVTNVMQEQKREKERKAEKQFTKTLSLVNLYTKMGDDLTPEDRMQLYTGALIPMLAKAGGLPEGTKKEDVSGFIGSLAAHSKEAIQGFREDNNKLLDLVNDGKWKEADKFLNGMMVEYGKLPGAKPFLDHAKGLLKDEKSYSRSKAGKQEERVHATNIEAERRTYAAGIETEKRRYVAGKEVGKGVLAGELQVVPQGQEEAFKGRPMVDYGKGVGLVAGRSEEQKMQSEARKAGIIATAKEEAKIPKPEMKESQAVSKISGIEKAIHSIETAGGMDSGIFALLAKSSPDLAAKIQGAPKEQVIEILNKEKQYLLDNFMSDETKKKYGYGKKASWKEYQQ